MPRAVLGGGGYVLIDIVRDVGEEVEEAWARADYAIDAFAPIAAIRHDR